MHTLCSEVPFTFWVEVAGEAPCRGTEKLGNPLLLGVLWCPEGPTVFATDFERGSELLV